MNSVTNIEQVQRRLAKLGVVEEKIANLQTEADSLRNEIQNLLFPASASRTAVPVTSTGKKKKGQLGPKILEYIRANPTKTTVNQIAEGMRIAPNQVALSLYHQVRNGHCFQQGESYYPAVALPSGAPSPTLDQNYEARG